MSSLHFHDEAQVVKYRQQLQDWVKGNVSMCKDSLFIIDEIDKMDGKMWGNGRNGRNGQNGKKVHFINFSDMSI